MNRLICLFLIVVFVTPACAYDFVPTPALDLTSVDKAMADDMFGKWEIRNDKGTKRCKFTLLKAETIGGMQINIDKNCGKAFPIMAKITAWRLGEGWAIDFVDAERHTRVRFTTPDDNYVAFGDDADVKDMDQLNKR